MEEQVKVHDPNNKGEYTEVPESWIQDYGYVPYNQPWPTRYDGDKAKPEQPKPATEQPKPDIPRPEPKGNGNPPKK